MLHKTCKSTKIKLPHAKLKTDGPNILASTAVKEQRTVLLQGTWNDEFEGFLEAKQCWSSPLIVNIPNDHSSFSLHLRLPIPFSCSICTMLFTVSCFGSQLHCACLQTLLLSLFLREPTVQAPSRKSSETLLHIAETVWINGQTSVKVKSPYMRNSTEEPYIDEQCKTKMHRMLT